MSNLSFCCCCLCLGVVSEIIAKSNVTKLFPGVSSWKFYSLSSYAEVFGPFWITFSYVMLGEGPALFFCMWICSFPSTFVERLSFPIGPCWKITWWHHVMSCMCMGVSFWTLYFISLFCMLSICQCHTTLIAVSFLF